MKYPAVAWDAPAHIANGTDAQSDFEKMKKQGNKKSAGWRFF